MKIHYDGWLKLSPALLRRLDAKSGDKFEAEIKDGALVLRPVGGKAGDPVPEEAVPSPAEPVPSKGRSSQPRTSDKAARSPTSVVLPAERRAGGRKPRTAG